MILKITVKKVIVKIARVELANGYCSCLVQSNNLKKSPHACGTFGRATIAGEGMEGIFRHFDWLKKDIMLTLQLT